MVTVSDWPFGPAMTTSGLLARGPVVAGAQRSRRQRPEAQPHALAVIVDGVLGRRERERLRRVPHGERQGFSVQSQGNDSRGRRDGHSWRRDYGMRDVGTARGGSFRLLGSWMTRNVRPCCCDCYARIRRA